MLTRSAYFDAWAGWHGGVRPVDSALVGAWLSAVYPIARRLRWCPPFLLTGLGVGVAVSVPSVARPTTAWLLAGALLTGLSGLLDSLDGAVAMITERATRLGYVVDSLADRISDSAYVVTLWVLGAPGWLCVPAAGLSFLQEYARARAGASGMTEIGVVTVWERPTRIILTGMLLTGTGVLLLAGVTPDVVAWVALGGAVVWNVLGLIGLTQVLLAIRSR